MQSHGKKEKNSKDMRSHKCVQTTHIALSRPKLSFGVELAFSIFNVYMSDPILTYFEFIRVVIKLRVKFEVSSFNRSRDIWIGSQNFKSRSHDPFTYPHWPNFAFCSLVHRMIYVMHAKLEVSIALTVSIIWRGSQNFKSRSLDPFTTPLT